MNSIKEQHELGVELLEVLGLTHVRLERKKNGSFAYAAWNTPLAAGNGSLKALKRGILRVVTG